MRLKTTILDVTSTETLRQIVVDFELPISKKSKRQDLMNAISSARRCRLEDLLDYLGEPEVKEVCDAAGVESRGRRGALVERLLEAASPAPASTQKPLLPSISNTLSQKSNHSPKTIPMNDNNSVQTPLQLASPDAGITNVEKYQFEPIKGYPMLNWRGKRPFTSTQYYPAQLKEVYGEEVKGWRNKIFWGDNLQVMSHLLKKFRGSVDLIYIDPPFDSKADYKKKIEFKSQTAATASSGFEEKQYSDIWTNDDYLQFMFERFCLMRELLSPTGVIFVHCDPKRNSHVRLIMDEIFGAEHFVNEIVWCYKSPGRSESNYKRKHDTILFYSKSNDYKFLAQRVPLSESTLSVWGKHFDDRGLITYGNMRKNAPGMYARLAKFGNPNDDDVFLDKNLGSPALDWWDDLPFLNKGKERTGYPTQKPEDLLERIIKTSTVEGDLVFDCFMGSGTTQAVSMKLGRRYIGADINLGAIQTTTKRLLGDMDNLRQHSIRELNFEFSGFETYNVNHYDVFRNPIQARDLLIEALEVQRLEFNTVFDGEKDGRMVKIMPVNRIATRADLNELIDGFDYKAWERRQNESPNRAVEKITLVCMGHEPDLRAQLELAAKPFKIDVEVLDILRDKADLEFKRDSQAKVAIKRGELVIEKFYPMNLLQKLSLQKEAVENWRELVESVLVDWNYDGAVLQPALVDIPGKSDLVKGAYKVPEDAGTIRVKITDLLSESWEGSISNG
jgi:adenine-specific DNA-methyltransferase